VTEPSDSQPDRRADPDAEADPDPAAERLDAAELALRVGVPIERIGELAALEINEPDDTGHYVPGDIHRVRLMNAFEAAGMPLDALLAASLEGHVTLAYYDRLHPSPGALSAQTYEEFGTSLGPSAAMLPRVFAAFGLAEPDATSRLPVDDEQLIAEVLEIVGDTPHPEHALRALRTYGDAATRASVGALDAYGAAIDREGERIATLSLDETFAQVVRPWARLARRSGAIVGWLAGRHLGAAIDTFTVAQTEQVLEDAGFVPTRSEASPAVAFVDLTGFTRITEERGDAAAAAIALRLGEVAADTIRPLRGRVVKLLGDGVLLRFDAPEDAAAATLDLLAALPPAALPSGHAGIASGPLVVRDGDVFGRTVNTAARIADAAPDGRLYAPEGLASALPAERFRVQPAEVAVLQGLGRLALVDITARSAWSSGRRDHRSSPIGPR
jgi:adenylate cyclase